VDSTTLFANTDLESIAFDLDYVTTITHNGFLAVRGVVLEDWSRLISQGRYVPVVAFEMLESAPLEFGRSIECLSSFGPSSSGSCAARARN
jgi:hypothetical protein